MPGPTSPTSSPSTRTHASLTRCISPRMRSGRTLAETAGKIIGGAHKCINNAGLSPGMTSIANDLQLRLRPDLVQGKRIIQRTNHVVTAMHNNAGNTGQLVRIRQQLLVVHEDFIDEVMR